MGVTFNYSWNVNIDEKAMSIRLSFLRMVFLGKEALTRKNNIKEKISKRVNTGKTNINKFIKNL